MGEIIQFPEKRSNGYYNLAALFDRAVAVIGIYDFNIASAYTLTANYIRKGGKICGIYE